MVQIQNFSNCWSHFATVFVYTFFFEPLNVQKFDTCVQRWVAFERKSFTCFQFENSTISCRRNHNAIVNELKIG